MKKSALDSVMAAFKSSSQAAKGASQAVSSRFLNSALDDLIGGVSNANSQFLGSILNRTDSKLPGHPIASMNTGKVLYSDGKQVQDPNQPNLDALKENVFAQHKFQPAAEKYLRQLPMHLEGSKSFLGAYRHRTGEDGNLDHASIALNPGMFSRPGEENLPADVLTHEYMHALDANVNTPYNASMQREEGNSGDSYGFTANGPVRDNHFALELKQFLTGYNKNGQEAPDEVKDKEAFAQTGAKLGNEVLLEKFGQNYDNIYMPLSNNINYSPVYPTSGFLEQFRRSEGKNKFF